MTVRLPVRRGTHVRRRRTVRRATPRVSSLRLRASALLVLCIALGAALVAGPFLSLSEVRVEGARFTSEAAVRAASGIGAGSGSTSPFAVEADRIAAALVRLPAVARAHVEVQLPSTLVVRIEERQPRLIWMIGEHRYVLDSSGMIFGEVDEARRPKASDAGPLATPVPSLSPQEPAFPTPTATPPAASPSAAKPPAASPPAASPPVAPGPPTLHPVPTGLPLPSIAAASVAPRDPSAGLDLPVVVDRLAADAGLHVGDTVDPTWLDAAYRIASLTPSDIGSTADRLATVIDDQYGLTLAPASGGWVADFGVYTPNLRRPDVIPEQVRALRTLLLASAVPGIAQPIEAHVAWVWLMGDVPGGTYSFLPK